MVKNVCLLSSAQEKIVHKSVVESIGVGVAEVK